MITAVTLRHLIGAYRRRGSAWSPWTIRLVARRVALWERRTGEAFSLTVISGDVGSEGGVVGAADGGNTSARPPITPT